MLVSGLLLLGAFVAAEYYRSSEIVRGSSVTPADLFMQSVATEDGGLGWRQLCPTLQSQLPREVLEQQSSAQRTIQAEQGVKLSIEHVGDRPRPTGGELRFYVATAVAADGSAGQKTYVVKTQSSGCVESVE
jgi:hypothetical protein